MRGLGPGRPRSGSARPRPPDNTPGVAAVDQATRPAAAKTLGGQRSGEGGRRRRGRSSPTRRRCGWPRPCWPSGRTGSSPRTARLIGLPDLRPGDNVEIHGVGRRFSGLYHVDKVTHTLNQQGYLTEFDASGRPDGDGRLPAARGRRPRGCRAPRSGSSPTSNDPDGLGRVEVELPWYADGYREWARVAQLLRRRHGRAARGSPRRAARCWCVFEHGDLRCPYVLGCLYNNVDRPPESRTSSSDIRTLRTPSGSEITFDETERAVELEDQAGRLGAAGGAERRAHAQGHVEDHAQGRRDRHRGDGSKVTVKGSSIALN